MSKEDPRAAVTVSKDGIIVALPSVATVAGKKTPEDLERRDAMEVAAAGAGCKVSGKEWCPIHMRYETPEENTACDAEIDAIALPNN